MAPYDLTIWSPGSASLYLDRGPATGGAELQMFLLARALASSGLRVCHVVSSAGGLPRHAHGVDLVPVDPPRDGALSTLARFTATLRHADAHVYLQRSAGLMTGVVGAFARSRRRAFVYSTASPMDLRGRLPLARREAVALRVGLRCAHAIVVQTQDQLDGAGRQRFPTVRIPSFCEPARPANSRRDIFVWVGRPARYKNPLAFVSLAKLLPEAHFVMVGIDPGGKTPRAPTELSAAAAEIPNLTLHPALPRAEVLPLYDRAVAVVNTSDFEGFPNTFLEGWARGALALSLSVDPDTVIARHRIGAVARGSLSELTAAATRMWRDRLASDSARRRAVGYVLEHHAPGVVAPRWYELIDSLRA